jgi:hypothetical protein
VRSREARLRAGGTQVAIAPRVRSFAFFAFALLACSSPTALPDGGVPDAGTGGAGGVTTFLPDGGGAGGATPSLPDAGLDASPGLSASVSSPVPIASFTGGVVAAGTVFNVLVAGESIPVIGAAAGGAAPYTFVWRSSLDGDLGTGDHATLTPSLGDHALVLVVTDAAGASVESAPVPLHVLPPTFDWSHVRRPSAPPAAGDWMTPVRYQSQCGSCWAFAALAVMEAQLNIQAGDPTLDVDLAEQDVIDCDTYNLGCIGGGTEQSLDGYLHDVGAPSEGCDPFAGHDATCLAACKDGSTPGRYRVESTSAAISPPGAAHDAVQAWMRYQLVKHGPIARSIVNMDGYDPQTHLCAAVGGDHYVAVVGYDHAAGLWLAKNSWGKSWNGNGYFEIAYGNCAIDASATFVDRVLTP